MEPGNQLQKITVFSFRRFQTLKKAKRKNALKN